MSPLPHLLRFLAILSLVFLGATSDARAAESVGSVTNVVNPAQIGSGSAAVGTPVYMNQRLRTGPNGRLQVTFGDHSVLTLGENANVAPVSLTVLSTSESASALIALSPL